MMDALNHEAALREEEIAKIRFGRQMEMRRQVMAEEAARLQAEFDRQRAQAAEQEARMKNREEVETLKLMLEYLAKQGAQQVTAEHLRNARAQAERAWQQEHADKERQDAEARRQQQLSAEKAMADRAWDLTQQLLSMQQELEGKRIDAGAPKTADISAVVANLKHLSDAAAAPAQPAKNTMAELDKWLDSLASKLGSIVGQQAPAAAQASTFGGNTRVCGNCGKVFSANAYMCPDCKWHP